ncbi:MAG: SDR family oxidoreductase [Magnetovibrio sp.]|nr:SDR family oxidoreductase [Magnetovibrio sp.]
MAEPRRTALITGSGKNIGQACALALAADGFNVVVNGSSDEDACQAVVDAARDLGVDAEVAMGDVGKEADCREIAKTAIHHFGAVDVLLNNAAIRPSSPFLEMSDDEWHRVMDTNFQAAFWLARACLPGMVDKGWGRIINFAGMNAIHGYNGRAHVSASKHAAWGLTKALAKEFGPKGVTVNIISPGPIGGDHKDPAMAQHIAELASRVPIGRIGVPDEVAAMAALLASDKGAFINGQILQVNGGAET